MKIKLLLATLIILASGFSAVGSTCLDNETIQVNSSFNGEYDNSTYVCDYGCDTELNRCRYVDVSYGGLALGVLSFFTGAMFFLSWYFRPPKPTANEYEEVDIGVVSLSLLFLFIGMLGVLGMLLLIAGIGSPLISSFIQANVEWIKLTYSIYGVILGVFITLIGVAFVINLLKSLRGVSSEEE